MPPVFVSQQVCCSIYDKPTENTGTDDSEEDDDNWVEFDGNAFLY